MVFIFEFPLACDESYMDVAMRATDGAISTDSDTDSGCQGYERASEGFVSWWPVCIHREEAEVEVAGTEIC